jgi:hypothetical protein
VPKGDPPVQLAPTVYQAWLKEDPKEVLGGEIQIKTVHHSGAGVDLHSFEAQQFTSEVLPDRYSKDLMLFGTSNIFEGFKIYATPRGFDYLLMAHQTHSGEMRAHDGATYAPGQPHYHELNLYKAGPDGGPDTKRRVTDALWTGMGAKDLLDAFAEEYHFDSGDGSLKSTHGGTATPKPAKPKQQNLEFVPKGGKK